MAKYFKKRGIFEKLGTLISAPIRSIRNKAQTEEIFKKMELTKVLNHNNSIFARQIASQLEGNIMIVNPPGHPKSSVIVIEDRCNVMLLDPKVEKIDNKLQAIIPLHISVNGEEEMIFIPEGKNSPEGQHARVLDCLRIGNDEDSQILISQCQNIAKGLRRDSELKKNKPDGMSGM